MELEISFCIVSAALSCAVFLLDDDSASQYGVKRVKTYLKLITLSALSALIGSATAITIASLAIKSNNLLPLLSVSAAVLIVSLAVRARLFAKEEHMTCELMIVSAVLSLFLVDERGEDITSALVFMIVSVLVYLLSCMLLYSVSARFRCPDKRKRQFILPITAIAASSLGFAAEGFKGILENLFT